MWSSIDGGKGGGVMWAAYGEAGGTAAGESDVAGDSEAEVEEADVCGIAMKKNRTIKRKVIKNRKGKT